MSLDVNALQARLRVFAAERQWQPFHTPKNLAMALMVEAAELTEIFQWMTPEQSLAVRDDPALTEPIADEVADVLLYLLQLADHAGVDLAQAVENKLRKNAVKHPAPCVGGAAVGGREIYIKCASGALLVSVGSYQ